MERSGARIATVLCALLFAAGCDSILVSLAGGSAARTYSYAGAALHRQGDYDMGGAAVQSLIATTEGLLEAVPDNDLAHTGLVRAYSIWAYGWLEDNFERATGAGPEQINRAGHARARAIFAYERARAIGLEQLNLWEPDDGGPTGARRRGIAAYRQWLRGFHSGEQAPTLYWTAFAWVRLAILGARDEHALSDAPFIFAMAARARQITPSLEEGVPGLIEAWTVGALAPGRESTVDPSARTAAVVLTDGIAATGRRQLLLLLTLARESESRGDLAAAVLLLREVLAAADVEPSYRIFNQFARRRARRDLDRLAPDAADPSGAGMTEGS